MKLKKLKAVNLKVLYNSNGSTQNWWKKWGNKKPEKRIKETLKSIDREKWRKKIEGKYNIFPKSRGLIYTNFEEKLEKIEVLQFFLHQSC